MIDPKKIEGMIDSSPIMKDFADVESSALPEFQIDSKIPDFFFNFFFFLQANKFDVALCFIPFQACSCFGNRRKIPHNKSNKSSFGEEELKTAGPQRGLHMRCLVLAFNTTQIRNTLP